MRQCRSTVSDCGPGQLKIVQVTSIGYGHAPTASPNVAGPSCAFTNFLGRKARSNPSTTAGRRRSCNIGCKTIVGVGYYLLFVFVTRYECSRSGTLGIAGDDEAQAHVERCLQSSSHSELDIMPETWKPPDQRPEAAAPQRAGEFCQRAETQEGEEGGEALFGRVHLFCLAVLSSYVPLQPWDELAAVPACLD